MTAPDRRTPRSRLAALMRWPLMTAFLLMLFGCGGDLQTPGEALRIFGSSLPEAFLGEEYDEQIRAVGGLRPFTFELTGGDLPPGLELVNGVVRGVPTEIGRYSFTVTVSDANLSRTFEDYTVAVVERPPPRLLVLTPETEVRDETTIRLRLEDASEVRAVSARLDWDEESFELVADSVSSEGSGKALLWRSEPGLLQVDVAALGAAWNEETVLVRFTLRPAGVSVPRVDARAVFLDDRGGRHYQGISGFEEELPDEDDGEVNDTEGVETDGDGEEPGDDEVRNDSEGTGDDSVAPDPPPSNAPADDEEEQ